MMTKKHFEAIAYAIGRNYRREVDHTYCDGDFIDDLADVFERDNPEFDRPRFWGAILAQADKSHPLG